MEAGIVDNRHEEIDLGITVATMLMGTRRLYRFAGHLQLLYGEIFSGPRMVGCGVGYYLQF